MKLNQIYPPIEKELKEIERALETSLKQSKNQSILKMGSFLLESPGKRIRPALVILSSKAVLSHQPSTINHQLINVATAVELIHMASLIHDDVIDKACLRHNKPTINSIWGEDVSVALGDYLYSIAFELISKCKNSDILQCISSATKAMCEGELLQVCEREKLDLLKERYIIIVKKKTASLFSACCQVGGIISHGKIFIQHALKGYGLNFGMAFQIVDDCLDLIGKREDLGKAVGVDFKMGELTLPILNLLAQTKEKNRILSLIKQKDSSAFSELRQRFINSEAFLKTKKDISSYIQKAKNNLRTLEDSCFKQSLFSLADYITERIRL